MVSDGAIRQEMTTFRSVLRFAATKNYIRENQLPRGPIQSDKNRREEFTPQEYRKLHTFGRGWIKEARWDMHSWYRTMAYNFMLVMTNTGMRPPEARNLRWRDVDTLADKHGRKFVTLAVRGKDKFRTLVAPHSVAAYLDRIRSLSKATKPDDYVFTTHKGKSAKALYRSLIQSLLKESELLLSSSGKRRSTYCFRHTYATFRLTEGVDVYFLAKQMGTSVLMIEKHYGHITPVKNADRILQGLPGWEPIADGPGDIPGSVNADGAGKKPAKPRTKK
jgi:integrase